MLTQRLNIRFADIVGISELNPRFGVEDDVTSLGATIKARGLLHVLIVHAAPETPDTYKVLDGGRRWRSLLLAPPETIDVDFVDGTESELREIALIPNVARKALHPVEEYEHFAALETSGMDVAAIARDFGITMRQVNQRLALGRLAPEIRTAWRAGKIGAEVAQAYTAGSIEAQTKLFADAQGQYWGEHDIRRRLQSDAIAPHEAEAVYVGDEAYRAAGGHVEDSLFEDEIVWLDGTLCKRLAREKMVREAEAIAAAEGWGFIQLEEDFVVVGDVEECAPDFLEAEKLRLDEIESELEAIYENDELPEETREATIAKLEIEQAEISAKATLRAIGEAERASYGIVVNLSEDGTRLVVTRGVKQRAADVSSGAQGNEQNSSRTNTSSGREGKPAGAAAPAPTGTGADEGGSSSAPDVSKDVGKAARAVLDDAMTQGFRAAVRNRPDLALLIAVAYLGPTYDTLRASSLAGGVSPHDDGMKHELLKALDGKHQDEALRLCSRAAPADLIAAFAEIVALSISTRNLGLSQLEPFAASLAHRGAALRAGFLSHLDYDAYFAGATKDAAISAIRVCDGEAAATEALKLKKKEAAIMAANSAKDSSWLPEPLAAWCTMPVVRTDVREDFSTDKRSTAQAMADAIADDEAQESGEKRDLAADFDDFLLSAAIQPGNNAEARAGAKPLLDAFNAFAARRGQLTLNTNDFAALMQARGFKKKRFAEGTFYLGLALQALPSADLPVAAE